MKRTIFVGIAVIVLAVAGFFAFRMFSPPPADLDLARSKPTHAGRFVAAIAPEEGEIRQGPLHSWIVTVTTPDGASVEDATIRVDGGMPQHGHGLPTEPAVTAALGQGRYRIEGMRFNMGGWWVLELEIEAGGVSDEVAFNILL